MRMLVDVCTRLRRRLIAMNYKARFPLPELTGRQHGQSTRVVETGLNNHSDYNEMSSYDVNKFRFFRSESIRRANESRMGQH